MKLLIVSRFDRSARAINTITKYAKLGKSLGHHVSLFSEPIGDMPDVPTSREPKAFDYVMFVVYETPDFPDLPYWRICWTRCQGNGGSSSIAQAGSTKRSTSNTTSIISRRWITTKAGNGSTASRR